MFKNSYGQINISVFFDKRRPVETNKYPVKIRVRYKRERKDYITGKKLTIEDWGKLQFAKSIQFVKLRNEIQLSFSIIDKIVENLYREDSFSFSALNYRIGKCVTNTLNAAFTDKIETLKNDGAIGNMSNYQSALKSVEKFAGNKITFNSITVEWLRQFEKHLLNENKSYVTVSMYIRCIRAIYNDAKRAGTVKEIHYPFGKDKYDIPTGEGRKLALTMQQIKQVVNYSDGKEITERYRDLWFFSYLCNGINFGDLL